MDTGNGQRANLKRKPDPDESNSRNRNTKRKLNTAGHSSPKRKPPFNNVNSSFSTSSNPPQSRLNRSSVKASRRIINRNFQQPWFPTDLGNINGPSISTSQPHSNFSVTSSANPSVSTNKKYSANNRLQSLRNNITKTIPHKGWYSSNLPPLFDNSQSLIQNNTYCNNEKNSESQNRKDTLASKKSFQPFEPMTKKFTKRSCISLCDDQAPTEYDDSQSAADFGNNSIALLQQEPSHTGYAKQCGNRNTNVRFKFVEQDEDTTNNCRDSVRSSSSIDKSDRLSSCDSNEDLNTWKKLPIKDRLGVKKFEPKTEISRVLNTESNLLNSKSYRNTQERHKPYSANNRLRNIRNATTTLNNNTLESLKVVKERLPTVTVKRNNSGFYRDGIGISNLANHNAVNEESQFNKRNVAFKQPSSLNHRLSNTRNNATNSKKVTILQDVSINPGNKIHVRQLQMNDPMENIQSGYKSFHLQTDNNYVKQITTACQSMKPQVSDTLATENIYFGHQPLNLLLARNHHMEPAQQFQNGYESMHHPSRNSFSDDSIDEPMDWDYIDEKETITTLQTLRKNVTETDDITRVPQTTFQETVSKTAPEMPHNTSIIKNIYVVVDTNIFISHLRIVKQVLQIQINRIETPIIMIPWMVIQELDYIKDGRSGEKLKARAQDAIRFINHKLTNKNPYVKGQSVMDAARQDFSSNNPDDGILHCCLQIINKRNKAILLSNDINLRNKALLHNIPAYSNESIINALDPYNLRDNDNVIPNGAKEDGRIKGLTTCLSHTCSFIILELFKQDYGSVWKTFTPNDPPWPLQKCIEIFNKYWTSIFSIHLNKQCRKVIDDFGKYLKTKRNGIIPIEDGEKLIEFGLSLCVFLKNGLPKFKSTVESCINEIQNMVL